MIINNLAKTLATITEEQWDALLRLGQQINVDTVTKFLEQKPVQEHQPVHDDLETRVRNLLKRLSIPASILGYKYLTDAIMLVYEDESYVHNMNKELYPKISKKYGGTPSRVERAIRHALGKAYEDANLSIMQEIFGNVTVKQTNSSSIAAFAEYLKRNN